MKHKRYCYINSSITIQSSSTCVDIVSEAFGLEKMKKKRGETRLVSILGEIHSKADTFAGTTPAFIRVINRSQNPCPKSPRSPSNQATGRRE